MTQDGFRFPPPPPPPPSTQASTSNAAAYGSRSQNGHRPHGARGGRGLQRGRFQGQASRGGVSSQSQAFSGRGDAWARSNKSPLRNETSNVSYHSPNKSGLKRPHNQAFGHRKPPSSNAHVAPAVPQFGAPLPSLPITANTISKPRTSELSKQNTNTLGLTPTAPDASSSEDEDIDEEAQLVKSIENNAHKPEKLVVTYKNKIFHLRNADEIAAWIKERRTHYPTRSKRGEAEQRMRELAAAKERLRKARDEAKAKKAAEAKSHDFTNSDIGQLKGAKFTKDELKAARTQQKIKVLQEQLKQQRSKLCKSQARHERGIASARQSETLQVDEVSLESSGSSSELSSTDPDSEDETSSSGSLSSSSEEVVVDDDGEDGRSSEGPSEEDLPKPVPPESKTAHQRRPPRQNLPKRICYHFKKHGICKLGSKCRFSHERIGQRPTKFGAKGGQRSARKGRMSLYERLVRQEKEKEKEIAVPEAGDGKMREQPPICSFE